MRWLSSLGWPAHPPDLSTGTPAIQTDLTHVNNLGAKTMGGWNRGSTPWCLESSLDRHQADGSVSQTAGWSRSGDGRFWTPWRRSSPLSALGSGSESASSYSYAPTGISDTQVPTEPVEGYLAQWLSGVDNDQELTDSD